MVTANTENLKKMNSMKMPFGKFKGTLLIDLPESYVIWFNNNSQKKSSFEKMMAELYEIKVNGLEALVKSIS